MKTKNPLTKKTNALKKTLTIRYAIALSLIACSFISAFIILKTQISQNEKDAYIVNVSGQQRMLSQRIALFSREVFHSENSEQADQLLIKMKVSVDKMRDNHDQLVMGRLTDHENFVPTENIKDIYFGETALNKRVRNYLDLATRFTNTYDQKGLQGVRNTNTMNQIVAIARNGLLNDLDKAVSIYQSEGEQRVANFKKVEITVLAIGLLLLICEALFIFHPMVRSVTKNIHELEVANTELTEFSYRISHDLRAPIVSSAGLVEVAANAVKNGQKPIATGALEHIKSSMVKLDSLIDDILNLTKLKLSDVEAEQVDCETLIDESMQKFASLSKDTKIDFQISVELEKSIRTKKLFLQQTLENLVSNSIKYADPSEKKSFIKILMRRDGGQIELSVTDNGLGIPKEFQSRLFEMFQRFHPEKSFGSGLGLYLVSQNARALDGQIKYEPTQNGSKFTLTFPEFIE